MKKFIEVHVLEPATDEFVPAILNLDHIYSVAPRVSSLASKGQGTGLTG